MGQTKNQFGYSWLKLEINILINCVIDFKANSSLFPDHWKGRVLLHQRLHKFAPLQFSDQGQRIFEDKKNVETTLVETGNEEK